MKKIFLIFILLMGIVSVLALSGCAGELSSVNETSTEGLSNGEATSGTPQTNGSSNPQTSPSIRYTTVFTSEEAYTSVKNSLLLSDQELEALDLTQYIDGVSGSTNRERVEWLVAFVEKISPYIPRVDETLLQYAGLTIYPQEEYFSLIYQQKNGVRYLIDYKVKDYARVDFSDQTPIAAKQVIGQYEFDLYEYLHMDTVPYWLGYFEIGSYTVEVMIDPPESKDDLILSSFYFVSEADKSLNQ